MNATPWSGRARRVSWIAPLVACLIVLGTSCADPGGGQDPAGPGSASASPPASPPASGTDPPTAWLAVLATADDADELDDETEALKPVLGTALVVGPVTCYQGLPADAGNGYVLAASSATRDGAIELANETGREPLLIVEIRVVCRD